MIPSAKSDQIVANSFINIIMLLLLLPGGMPWQVCDPLATSARVAGGHLHLHITVVMCPLFASIVSVIVRQSQMFLVVVSSGLTPSYPPILPEPQHWVSDKTSLGSWPPPALPCLGPVRVWRPSCV